MPKEKPSIDSDTKDLDTVAKAVGLVVLQWGQAEQSLDLLIALVWHEFGGKSRAKRIPKMLETKLEFLRKCASQSPKLESHSRQIENLVSSFESLSNFRHDLIHGALACIAPVDNAFVFSRLEIKDGYHHHREIRMDIKQYPLLVKKLIDLGRDALDLTAKIFRLLNN